jgi:uncharacterized membrane protein
MSKVEDFLTQEEEKAIVESIRIAETNTSGEIRVHIESSSTLDAYTKAKIIFERLEMHKTKLKNGVLVYLAVEDRKFAIIGDSGINDIVPQNFWDSIKDLMFHHFKNNDFKQGLIDGILKIGLELKTHFPYSENDVNELSNEISKGK